MYENVPPEEKEEEPCTAQYSVNGLCPCCGVEIRLINPIWASPGHIQQCPHCGWEGDILYDL